MSYSAKAIANFFVKKALSERVNDMSPMKLLKMIYIAHGWNLAINHQPLINESVEAWKYGPVIPEVYQEFKHFGNSSITTPIVEYDFTQVGKVNVNKYEIKFDDDTLALLERVWNVYKVNSGIQLSNWSHLEGSPWYETVYKQGGYNLNVPISNELIKNYFTQVLRNAQDEQQRN